MFTEIDNIFSKTLWRYGTAHWLSLLCWRLLSTSHRQRAYFERNLSTYAQRKLNK